MQIICTNLITLTLADSITNKLDKWTTITLLTTILRNRKIKIKVLIISIRCLKIRRRIRGAPVMQLQGHSKTTIPLRPCMSQGIICKPSSKVQSKIEILRAHFMGKARQHCKTTIKLSQKVILGSLNSNQQLPTPTPKPTKPSTTKKHTKRTKKS